MWRPPCSHFSDTIGRRVIADQDVPQRLGDREAVTLPGLLKGQRSIAMMPAHVELSPDFLQSQGYCLDTIYTKSRTDPRSFGPTYFIGTRPMVGHLLGQMNTNRHGRSGVLA